MELAPHILVYLDPHFILLVAIAINFQVVTVVAELVVVPSTLVLGCHELLND